MAINILRLSTDLQIEIIRNLASRPDRAYLLDMIVNTAMREIEADACSTYLEDPQVSEEGRSATMVAGRGYQAYAVNIAKCRIVAPNEVSTKPGVDEKLGLTGWVISTGTSFLAKSAADVFQHPHWSGKYDERQAPAQKTLKLAAFLGVPLRNLFGQVIGVLKAERREGSAAEPFSVENQIALEALGRVTSRCVAYVEQAEQGQLEAAITAWALNVIEEAVANEGDLDAFLDIAVRVSAAASGADSCAVFLVDESKKTLTQRAGWGNQVLRTLIRSYKLATTEQVQGCAKEDLCQPPNCPAECHFGDEQQKVGLTAWVAATGRSFHARTYTELQAHCHHLGRFNTPNYEPGQQCGAWLGVPLRVGGIVTGVLKIENVEQIGIEVIRDFAIDVQQRLDVLASNIGLAIERLQNQSPGRYEIIQKAMPTLLEILQGGLDVPTLVEKVVTKTMDLFKARACALFLKEGNKLIQPAWAAQGWAEKGVKVRSYDLVPREEIAENPAPDSKKGLTVWIAVTKQKFIAKSNLELTLHPHHLGHYDTQNFDGSEKCETFMGIPLLVGEQKELIGVLKVETKMKETPSGREFAYFNEQDELVFDLIGNCAAIAIQNARLLESRRLAHSIITQPTTETLPELCRFTKVRMGVVSSSLDTTALEVKQRDPGKARIIENFAGLLTPESNVAILEQLASDQREDVQSALHFCANALNVRTCAEIAHLRSTLLDKAPMAQILNPSFFYYDFMDLLLRTQELLSAEWKRYSNDPTQKEALRNCLDRLREDRESLDDLGFFERTLLTRIFRRWRGLFDEENRKWQSIPNPYIAGLPLPPGSPVFVGRSDIFRWIQENLKGQEQKNVIVLHGGWHTGKTSILKQLEAGPQGKNLREQPRTPVYPVFVDLQSIGTSPHLLRRLADSIQKSLTRTGINCPVINRLEFVSDAYGAFHTFVEEINSLLTKRGNGLLVLMIDEFEILDEQVKRGSLDREIFAYLRSIMQHQSQVTFILAGRHRLDQMTPEYRNIIFNVALHKEVGFLEEQEAIRLIQDPVKPFGVDYDNPVVNRIIELSGRHPYLIQQLCHACIERLNFAKSGRKVTLALLDYAVDDSLVYNPLLENFYLNEISPEEQRVLQALAELSPAGRTWVSATSIASEAKVPGDKLREVMESLLAHRVVEEHSGPQRRNIAEYRFGMDLLLSSLTRRRARAAT